MITSTWYWYQRGGWQIAVDATSKHDADEHIKQQAPGAEYQGNYTPPVTTWSSATAMTTNKRQAEISVKVKL